MAEAGLKVTVDVDSAIREAVHRVLTTPTTDQVEAALASWYGEGAVWDDESRTAMHDALAAAWAVRS